MKNSRFRTWIAGVWHDATLKINIEEQNHGTGGANLVRTMGLISVILFTITSAVGSGILTTPGIIAHDYAGPFAYMSFLDAAAICICPALCLGYMASRIAKSGSTGSYACMVLGQLPGLLMFVDVMMECIGGTAAVAVSQSDHIKLVYKLICKKWFGVDSELPAFWTTTPEAINWWMLLGAIVGGTIVAVTPRLLRYCNTNREALAKYIQPRVVTIALVTVGVLGGIGGAYCGYHFAIELPSINCLSVLVVAGICGILLLGVKETAFLTNAFTVTKLVVLSVIIVILRKHYNAVNHGLPVPPEMPGAFAGASMAFFAFVGLDLATTTAGEVKNPKRNVPLGMLIGLVAVSILYFLAAYYLTAAVPYTLLGKGSEGQSAPMVRALEILGYDEAAIWIGIGSTVALISVVLASAYSTTRLLFNMAQHGLMPSYFEKLSEKRKVPVRATLAVGAFICILTGLMAVGELMHLTNIGTMTAFMTISLTVIILVVRETAWRTWRGALKGSLWVLVGVGGIVGPARLLCELPWEAFVRLVVVWTAVIVLFITYSRKHSLARRQEAEHKEEKQ